MNALQLYRLKTWKLELWRCSLVETGVQSNKADPLLPPRPRPKVSARHGQRKDCKRCDKLLKWCKLLKNKHFSVFSRSDMCILPTKRYKIVKGTPGTNAKKCVRVAYQE
eukprot:6466874-Amphidinium_carterae.1